MPRAISMDMEPALGMALPRAYTGLRKDLARSWAGPSVSRMLLSAMVIVTQTAHRDRFVKELRRATSVTRSHLDIWSLHAAAVAAPPSTASSPSAPAAPAHSPVPARYTPRSARDDAGYRYVPTSLGYRVFPPRRSEPPRACSREPYKERPPGGGLLSPPPRPRFGRFPLGGRRRLEGVAASQTTSALMARGDMMAPPGVVALVASGNHRAATFWGPSQKAPGLVMHEKEGRGYPLPLDPF